jgi:hypothetical protein
VVDGMWRRRCCGGALRRRSEDLPDGANAQLPWRATAAGLGLDLLWACGCGGYVLRPGGLLWRRIGPSFPLLLGGGARAAGLNQIMEGVLGFLSHQNKDLSDTYRH